MELLWLSIILVLLGIALNIFATWMIERSRPRATDELPPGVGEIIGKAIAAMFAAVNDILAGATAWHKVRGLGSLSLLAGFVLFVVFVVGKLA